MKKITVLLIALVFMFASLSHAWDRIVPVAWKTVVCENNSAGYVNYAIPTTTIRPNKSIMGYVVIPIGGGNMECIVGLYDGVGQANIVSDELFDEAESDGTQSQPTWFPYPRKILTQLNVRVGPYTKAIIYWD